jgi:3-phenylpropionate/trans-cinnamate dioxygenase ferredoxin subunit
VTVVGTVADFPVGTHRIVTVDGREVGVFNIGGKLYGLANRCAHQGGPLCAAKRTTGTLVAEAPDYQPRWAFEGEIIACPWHGLEYHVPTGRCLADARIRIRRYDVTLDGDDVVVTPASIRRPPAASGR